MTRLSNDQLDRLPESVRRFAYDRTNLRAGIVHIGIGAFHRGHMAVYIDDLLSRDPNWAIRGASMRRPDTKDALAPQDYLYSVTVQDGAQTDTRIIGSVIDIIDASADSGPLIAELASGDTHVVSLTVTEKGYCHNPATGKLALQHPDIVHDLQHPDNPRSVPGILVAAAAARRGRGLPGLTVLSCDNLHGNGRVARATVMAMAALRDPSLPDWIATNFTFPATMVDRIVPALTDQDRCDIGARLTMTDQWPIITEPFHQWVIEDDFAAAMPDLSSVGVQIVPDVEPFETMKLRMLNGSHSSLAYLGQLAGYDLVSEAIGDAAIRRFITSLMTQEVIPTLDVPGQDLPAYRDALLTRFANPALRHRLAQIATDGSQKLPQRIAAPMQERIKQGSCVELLALTLAGWMAFVHRQVQNSEAVPDTMGDQLAKAVRGIDDPDQVVHNLLAIGEIFDAGLAGNADVTALLGGHLRCIQSNGVLAAITQTLDKSSGA